MAQQLVIASCAAGIIFSVYQQFRQVFPVGGKNSDGLEEEAVEFSNTQSDNFKCLTIELSQKDSISLNQFQQALQLLVENQKSQKYHKAIWLKLHLNNMFLSQIAIDLGFVIHHAMDEYILLSLWLLQEKSNLPLYPRHMIAAGGIVISREQKAVLLVQQGRGNREGMWGLPGGHVDKMEQFGQCAEREVKEETSLDVKAVDIFGFQYYSPINWKTESIFFIYIMQLKDQKDAQQIEIDEFEIKSYKWVEIDQIDDFIKQNRVTHTNYLTRVPDYFNSLNNSNKLKTTTEQETYLVETGECQKTSLFFNNFDSI